MPQSLHRAAALRHRQRRRHELLSCRTTSSANKARLKRLRSGAMTTVTMLHHCSIGSDNLVAHQLRGRALAAVMPFPHNHSSGGVNQSMAVRLAQHKAQITTAMAAPCATVGQAAQVMAVADTIMLQHLAARPAMLRHTIRIQRAMLMRRHKHHMQRRCSATAAAVSAAVT